MKTDNKITTVSAVDKAIDILTALGKEDNKTIRELGAQLNITKSTLHRILQTLEIKGLVKKNSVTEKYSLGYKLLELSSRLKLQNEVREVAIGYMEELSRKTGDTVQLAIVEQNEIIITETVEGTNDLRVFARSGQRYPLTYGNFGRIFLSYQSEPEIYNTITQFPLKKYASSSIIDSNTYISKIDEVRRAKISCTLDDPIEGAMSMAVPIENSYGEVIASLAIAGVKTKKKNEEIEELKELLIDYGTKISNEFIK